MSEGYCVVNRKRKKEYEEFVDFWENKLYPSFIQQLKEYGEKVNGEIINREIVDWVLWGGDGLPTSYCPLSDDSYRQNFGYYNETTEEFHFWGSRETEIFDHRVYDRRSLKELMDSNQDLYIMSDYEQREMSFDEFVAEVNPQNMFGPV